MSRNMEPKIANFNFSRMHNDITSDIEKSLLVMTNWMAPEKMEEHYGEQGKSIKVSYTQKQEIFSYGMLVWELCYRKIPYKEMSPNEIAEHVMKRGREKLSGPFSDSLVSNENEIQEGFNNIIKSAWIHNEDERINIDELYLKLSDLKRNIKSDPSPILYSSSEHSPEEYKRILTIEEGIKLHQSNDPQKRIVAWECFITYDFLGNSLATYWKGYYLLEGYYTDKQRTEDQKNNDRDRAKELFKIAADKGIINAQFYYAVCLPKSKNSKPELIKYLRMAADNGHSGAQFNLARILLENNKDKDIGLRYLNLAIQNNNRKAVEFKKKLNLDIDNSNNDE
ncbi:9664_t:CDS:2 [Acaulospora morrowiae]|uniref:9664_t:CDS:1 n=1 Tax=Acaulospora morrowiae TaxID=94023 RepID=A0A9N9NV40_9GLOM|nr:9664_t:CDS:2 [Acaulospora morrowiae]